MSDWICDFVDGFTDALSDIFEAGFIGATAARVVIVSLGMAAFFGAAWLIAR